MKKFVLFVGGLVALMVLLSTLGPMVFLAVSVLLLYVIFKQFAKSDSTIGKVGWVIAGLIVLGIAFSNIYAVIGVVAAYALYLIIKNWKNDKTEAAGYEKVEEDDPFKNFERQWAELNN
ncbi:flagellar basal body rod protein [Virgibacillus phasianinus]|uniref:Flagellar basal body rod protein n=1 Tax=Virgibacillus phasianinus TaxID=2017483 RepID=A0A220U3C0_9BACI|nr:flagellar basal body rod protein [Virgibacillus phasianinus]ASK62784.1 flagellar basal body rod protein [Virgibacillus phasianinus]